MGKIEDANERLKAAGNPMRLRVRGNSLYLRTSSRLFPPKPGDVAGTRYELPQGPMGATLIRRTEAKAHEMWAAVIERRFDWADWIPTTSRRDTVAHWVEILREQHCRSGRCSPTTWEVYWVDEVFSRLPQDATLTPQLLLAAVLATPENTRQRQQTCRKLAKLAQAAGLGIDLREYQGTYGHSAVERRELPTDEQIEGWYEGINSEPWRIIFARIAAFGLRPSEAFEFELVDAYTAIVVDAKSRKQRETKALHPRWGEQWTMDGELPAINTTANRTAHTISNRIRVALRRRHGVTCQRYDLRHAWCVRGSVEYKIPTALMAQWAGHSSAVHDSLYLRWLRKDQGDRAYRDIVLGED